MKKKILFTLICGLLLASCSSPNKTTDASSTGKLKAGVYTVTTPGMNDTIEVEVKVSDLAIEDIKVLSHLETPGIGGELKDKDGKVLRTGVEVPTLDIPERIVDSQSLEVDDVTGATISSRAIKRAVSQALQDAGANLDDFKTKVVVDKEVEDLDADVVIVGGGGSGLAAAIAAAQEGKKVIVIEKNGAVGGNTLVCGAIYNTPNEETQSKVEMIDSVKTTIEKGLAVEPKDDAHKALIDEVNAQWTKYKNDKRTDLFDSKEWYALQTYNGGDNVANLDLVKALTYNAYGAFAWIKDLGLEFEEGVKQGAGSLWQRTHTTKMSMGTGFISTYVSQVEKYDSLIDILVETSATGLITGEDRVMGVAVKDNATEKEYTITAKDGVIISTGGFGANGEMVQEYNTSGKWDDLSKTTTTNRESSSQGDGIIMAKEVGASLTDMEQIQLLYFGNMVDGQIRKYPPRNANGTDQLIFINKEGKRFVREDGRRDEISKGVMAQTDAMFYFLESGDGSAYIDVNDPNWKSADGFSFDHLKENGFILVGDTIEDLAKQIGCDPQTLQDTIDTFNKSVETGQDEFGRTLFTTKLENGPWVATPRQTSIHHTMGGITIDPQGRVLDSDGNPILALYAAGEVTGGIHGANRLGGNAVVDTVVFGKMAADTLVADSK